ncbi:probable trehalose-phosphate phosphatase 3 isoform X2 [Salvia hispanica]|nr:probable trehalose-phosphate phosphatase 3 isoform X2 [Salvia hispanica]XP_047973056.1 probable trehalose-phosphate phosphatase 3 isoform X2 [Salvia hispanica]XP_047973057.1 probable trehalose-phosphate phosphatase 3 isoform X2 [Salvia hispanica]
MVTENMRRFYNKAVGYLSGPNSSGSEPSIVEPNQPNEIYTSWLKEHPSALTWFNETTGEAMRGKKIVVFLDYDGTLSPIVNDPDRAFMSDAMRCAVREVAKHFPTAIISGRSRDKVYGFVKLDEIYYAGSHGMDIMGPPSHVNSYDNKFQTNTMDKKGNKITIFQPAQEYLPTIKKLLEEIKQKTLDIPGVFVEDNTFCISVHYRHVLIEDCGDLEGRIHNLLLEYPIFHLTRGKKVLEIRPSIEWNKGDALSYLLKTLGFSDSGDDVIPFYIGDDKTDEDAFKVLKSRGQGHGIVVSTSPRETSASYSLKDPTEVLSFLLRLSRWGDTLKST